MWSSKLHILRTVLASCSCATALFSTAITSIFSPRTPTYGGNMSRKWQPHTKLWLNQIQKGRQLAISPPEATLTTVDPFLTASWAYSTWKMCPSGEKMVNAVSYRELIASVHAADEAIPTFKSKLEMGQTVQVIAGRIWDGLASQTTY